MLRVVKASPGLVGDGAANSALEINDFFVCFSSRSWRDTTLLESNCSDVCIMVGLVRYEWEEQHLAKKMSLAIGSLSGKPGCEKECMEQLSDHILYAHVHSLLVPASTR